MMSLFVNMDTDLNAGLYSLRIEDLVSVDIRSKMVELASSKRVFILLFVSSI